MKEPTRPPMPRASSAGALLRELLGRWGMEAKMREYRAWAVWDEVVGPQIAARARPAKIRNGVLEVRVDQPVWMQQLQLMKPKILSRLNERLGESVIADIYWRRGRLEQSGTAANPGSGLSSNRRKVPLDPEEHSAIEAALAPVTDPEVRQGLRSLFSRQLQSAKKPKS